MQQHSLLQTKLCIPPIRPELISRPRLIEQLNAGLPTRGDLSRAQDAFPRALTLVSAPAGFGKTTLISEWVQAVGGATPPMAIAWLALDEGDNDPASIRLEDRPEADELRQLVESGQLQMLAACRFVSLSHSPSLKSAINPMNSTFG